ncbi:uncharacterized protein P174DRAFT_452129 [Aspergillus novofumigatus IBT 16806]|uniref:Uncharacterized protein n=1 Tax=Aspergillus novofumigatus (strain IBT 16806) TaxID=1392255 RepID=A0A2I1C5I7_ASPN1|nr:uncharacterized protein P174DRAFT_452129 [Aspergillus novofumigatus IBT 16806]PKX92855.1 hypothetical protein P174DRAFT_452129 [Aspergillus novofumigatus IBT 16806]
MHQLREGHWVVPEDDGELEGPDQRTDLCKEELHGDLGVLKIVKAQQLQRKRELEETLKGLQEQFEAADAAFNEKHPSPVQYQSVSRASHGPLV